VVVEHNLTAHDHDVVSSMTAGRANPERLEAAPGIGIEKRIREDVARPGGKQDPVG
jgi:hypothetical protein